ncbi:MAG: glycine cleavage system aminomethyltransferase GcvT [Xanthobacteraceae bacterium]
MTESPVQDPPPPERTSLYGLHLSRGGRMVTFAGFEMPVHYSLGVLKEHLFTRSSAGLFDVSHMGQVSLRPRSGSMADLVVALERIVPANLRTLGVGRQRYAVLTNDKGGIIDDLMIANLGGLFQIIVNAATKHSDLRHLQITLGSQCHIEPLVDRSLIGLQGPKAEAILADVMPGVEQMRFMDVRRKSIGAGECIVSRSGYTGEDGFEISVPASATVTFVEALLRNPAVELVGLGARDSLRLEAGLCLYGCDICTSTTPVEAALEWTIRSERADSPSPEFAGADVIRRQLRDGASRRRVGLRPDGQVPVRGGVALFADEFLRTPVGTVTSGGYGPSFSAPIAMGYVLRPLAELGTRIYAEVRGKLIPIAVEGLPFVPYRYKR